MLIIGHRGAPSLARENTLESFQVALESNVDGIELDVQLSKDNKLVVFHDLDTHSINGKHDLIQTFSFDDLKQINTKLQISTLEDVLKIFPNDKELHIEIKSETINNEFIINAVLALILKYQIQNQTIISSFNPFVLLQLKQKDINIRLGLLWTQNSAAPWFITHYSYFKIQPYSFHASIEYIDQELASWVKNYDMKLYCYTINDKQSLKKSQSLSCDGIFSDFPNILNI